jgi:hypothetical protein
MRLSIVAHFSTSKVTPSVPLSLVAINPIRIVMFLFDGSPSPDLILEAIIYMLSGEILLSGLFPKLFYLNFFRGMRQRYPLLMPFVVVG